MSIFRRRPLPGRRLTEQLLDGAGPVPPAHDDLAGLLAAARSRDVTGSELPGEQAALAAFRAAQAPAADVLSSASTPEEYTSVRTLALRRMLAVKVLAAGALTMTVGGVAFAATGMPIPGTKHDAPKSVAAAHATSASPTDKPVKLSSPTGTRTMPADATSKPAKPGFVRPGTDVRAMHLIQCRAWRAVEKGRFRGEHPGLRHKEFKGLVKAAGGADKVAAYCDELVATLCTNVKPGAGGASPSAHPGFLPGCPRPWTTNKPTVKPTAPGPKPTRTRPMPTLTTGKGGPLPKPSATLTGGPYTGGTNS